MEINERIFYLLKKQGKTASSLANYLNIKPSSITGWKNEGSFPSSKYIQKISEFLNVTIEYLVTGNDTSTNSNIVTAPVNTGGSFVQGVHSSVSIQNLSEHELTEDVSEILRIAKLLDIKKRHRLLNLAYTLEEEMNKN